MSRILVKETIQFHNQTLAPGRLIRTSTPELIIKQYGQKVALWHNWPEPMEEKKAVTPPSQEEE